MWSWRANRCPIRSDDGEHAAGFGGGTARSRTSRRRRRPGPPVGGERGAGAATPSAASLETWTAGGAGSLQRPESEPSRACPRRRPAAGFTTASMQWPPPASSSGRRASGERRARVSPETRIACGRGRDARSPPDAPPRRHRHGRQRRLGAAPGMKRTEGHAAGRGAVRRAVEGALEVGVEWMTVYAFSDRELAPPARRVRFLMRFNESLLLRRRERPGPAGSAGPLHRSPRCRVPRRAASHRGHRGADRPESPPHPHLRLQLRRPVELVDAMRAIGREVATGRPIRSASTSGWWRVTSMPRTCPTPSAGAHVGSTGSRTSCSGKRRIRARFHRRALARLPPSTPVRRDRQYQQRDRRFGAIED